MLELTMALYYNLLPDKTKMEVFDRFGNLTQMRKFSIILAWYNEIDIFMSKYETEESKTNSIRILGRSINSIKVNGEE